MKISYFYTAVFLLLVTAVFLCLNLGGGLSDRLQAAAARQGKIRSFKGKGKLAKGANKLVNRGRDLIFDSQIPLPVYALFTVVGAVGGFAAGKFIYSSTLIALAVGVIGMIVPLLVLAFQQTKVKTVQLQRLASSMTILSNSYLSTEDFLQSVKENLDNLDTPKPFRDFLTYVTYMSSDIKYGLRRMEEQVQNAYFSQWIDALCMAQDDRSLKYVCTSVVDSMHDAIAAQQESDAAMAAVWRDYILTLVLIFSTPLVFRFLMADAYTILVSSAVGQGLFVLLLLAVLFSVFRAIKINTPLVS